MGALDTTPRTWSAGEVVTAAMLNAEVRDKFTELQGVWTAYTPTWVGFTTNPTVTARYMRVGKTIHFRIDGVLNAAPTGAVTVTVPFGTRALVSGISQAVGVFHAKDVSAGQYWAGILIADSGASFTAVRPMLSASSTNPLLAQMAATTPLAWASPDSISMYGSYELA